MRGLVVAAMSIMADSYAHAVIQSKQPISLDWGMSSRQGLRATMEAGIMFQ